jgi:hypothetical protein
MIRRETVADATHSGRAIQLAVIADSVMIPPCREIAWKIAAA